jgi:hypothetical protein
MLNLSASLSSLARRPAGLFDGLPCGMMYRNWLGGPLGSDWVAHPARDGLLSGVLAALARHRG